MDFGEIAAIANPVAMIANAGTSLGTSIFNAREQSRLNDRAEANSWDMYQQNRADTASAHQREVADLKAAGLNPILSTHSTGASSATGSAPTFTAPKVEMPDLFANLISLKQLQQADRKLDQMDKEIAIKALTQTAQGSLWKSQEFLNRYGRQGIEAKFWKGLLNEDNKNPSMNDLIKGAQQIYRMFQQNARQPNLNNSPYEGDPLRGGLE